MKKFIKQFLIFIPFAGLIYCLLLIIWGLILPIQLTANLKYKMGLTGFMNTRLKEIKQIKNPDILFLGSSHTYRGFDPRIFKAHHLSSFNLGSSNQTPLQTKNLLETYLDSLNPKLIIYEVYPDNFMNDGVESSIDLISNNEMGKLSLKQAFSVNHILTYNTLLFAVFRKTFFNDNNFTESDRNITEKDTYISGGFVQKDPLINKQKSLYDHEKWIFKEKQINAFRQSIAFIKQKQIPFLLVQAPVIKNLFYSFTNNQAVDSLFCSYGPYLNFNYYFNFSDSLDFFDDHHLNQNGVQKFNEMLIKQLKSNNLISIP